MINLSDGSPRILGRTTYVGTLQALKHNYKKKIECDETTHLVTFTDLQHI